MKFSIIMPTFRRDHCIQNTVNTIINQTYDNWELIIIDNDGSLQCEFDDNRIAVYVHKERISAAYARNVGIRYIDGDVVCFFDDDDFMRDIYLEEMHNAYAQNPKCKMAVCWIDANHENKRIRYATPCCATKRNCIKPVWRNIGQLQDQDYYKEIIRANKLQPDKEIIYIDKILAFVGHSNKGGLRDPKGKF